MKKYDLRLTILIGLIFRLILMPLTAHPFDVYSWYIYCRDISATTFGHFVLNSAKPLWYLILYVISHVYTLLAEISGLASTNIDTLPPIFNPHYGIELIPGPLFTTLVKIPLIISDIGITSIIYKIVNISYTKKQAIHTASLFYLNPITIWISAGWGQYDSLPTLFIILSLYFFINGKEVTSAITLLVASLFKAYSLAFFMPYLLYLYKRKKKRTLIRYSIIFLSIYFIFIMSKQISSAGHPLNNLLTVFFFNDTFYSIFGYGLTYWSVSMLFPIQTIFWAPITSIIMVILLILSTYVTLNETFDDSLKSLTFSSILFISAFFLSSRWVSEQWIICLIPFLALMVNQKDIKPNLFWSISIISFLYTQKNFPYYLLPLASIKPTFLLQFFDITKPFRSISNGILLPSFSGRIILSILGTIFSLLLLKIVFHIYKTIKYENINV